MQIQTFDVLKEKDLLDGDQSIIYSINLILQLCALRTTRLTHVK